MEMALGMLHWSPATLWDASFAELTAAIDGLVEFNGGKKRDGLSDDLRAELMEIAKDAPKRWRPKSNGKTADH